MIRRQNPADDPGPPEGVPERRVSDRRTHRRRGGGPTTARVVGQRRLEGLTAPRSAPVRIAFLGFGLISGSVARALRASPSRAGWQLVAWSPSGAGPAAAVADGVIDRAAADVPAAIRAPTSSSSAVPRRPASTLLDGLAGPWSAGAGAGRGDHGRRQHQGGARWRVPMPSGSRYVGGHPMAGLDTAGYAASTADAVRRPAVGDRAGRGGRATATSTPWPRWRAPAAPGRSLMDAAEHDAAVAGDQPSPAGPRRGAGRGRERSGRRAARGLAAGGRPRRRAAGAT